MTIARQTEQIFFGHRDLDDLFNNQRSRTLPRTKITTLDKESEGKSYSARRISNHGQSCVLLVFMLETHLRTIFNM